MSDAVADSTPFRVKNMTFKLRPGNDHDRGRTLRRKWAKQGVRLKTTQNPSHLALKMAQLTPTSSSLSINGTPYLNQSKPVFWRWFEQAESAWNAPNITKKVFPSRFRRRMPGFPPWLGRVPLTRLIDSCNGVRGQMDFHFFLGHRQWLPRSAGEFLRDTPRE